MKIFSRIFGRKYKQENPSPDNHVKSSQEECVIDYTQAIELKERKDVDGLIAVLNDKNMDVLYTVANALGEIGNEKAVDGLIAALSDENMDVRHHAAYALAKTGNMKAVDPLITVLNDTTDYPVFKVPLQISCTPIDARVAAAIALGKIGGEAAISALKSFTSTSKTKGAYHGSSVAEAVAKALEELGVGDPEEEMKHSSEESGKSADKSSEEQISLENNNDAEHELRVGDIVDIDPLVLGQCVVERIETNPDGRGDIAFVRAENAVSPLEYESEPGDSTLYQFRVWFLQDKVKRL